MTDLREKLAEQAHESWSGWMRYLFDKCRPGESQLDDYSRVPNGTVVIPRELVERWQRQMNTPYSELPESERESDRKEADRYMAIFREEKR